MKYRFRLVSFILVISLLLSMASFASAQSTTEVYGFYEGYRNFDYKTGGEGYPFILDAELNGGGGGIAYQYVPWFALFTQVSFLGTAKSDTLSARVINNLQGVRYSTPQYGPVSFYGKGGVGFTNYSVTITGLGESGGTKLSVGYAGGIQVWVTDYIGVMVEAQHLIMGVPHIFEAEGRDRWDSGMTYKTGLAIRF